MSKKSIPSWFPIFNSHLPPAPTFSLASLSHDGYPTVRTCVYRGTLFNLPPNSRNPIRSINPEPSALSSSLLAFTTDARMAKSSELHSNPRAEACFWVEGADEKPQWRLRGKIHFFSYLESLDEKGEREAVAEDVYGVEDEMVAREAFPVGGDEVSWKREVLRHFANLGPGMRGTFVNPPPGTEFDEGRSGELGRKILDSTLRREFLGESSEEAEENAVEKRKVLYEALENFRVGVIKVDRIDRVDLAAKGGKGRRWIYERKDDSWSEHEVWP